ncbi:hypothetical protein HNQ55_001609 [Thalassotalea piscium]|uniref:Uncharacterized protein n=1 Tax=Thalassotalea piscium TaxID=1230533 RepID=A0A7X0NGL5_9GAMM|nr:hypothetical protein [Thalassotalea piscium]
MSMDFTFERRECDIQDRLSDQLIDELTCDFEL